MIDDPTKRDALWGLKLTSNEGLMGDVNVKGSLGSTDHEAVEFRIMRGEGRGGKASLQPWTSGEQVLAFSKICLVECHGLRPWKEEGPKKVG